MPVVSLADVVEALDLQSDELRSYLDPATGELVTFNDELALIAEGGEWEKQPQWMRDSLPKIKRALVHDRMLALPDRAHIDEWRMMQDYAEEEAQCQCRSELLSAIHGPEAFRRFRDQISKLHLEQSWYKYRQAAFERIAREWLQGNGISYR